VRVKGDGLIPTGFAIADLDHGVVEDGEFDDGGGLDGEVGVDGDGFIGVELGGVEGDVAEAGGGAGGGELLEELLEVGSRGLGGHVFYGGGEGEHAKENCEAPVQGVG
jgi:hypothetical protein